MGRYYEGDIEGKFWFGIQSSTDASFFGGDEIEPNYTIYYFDKDDLGDIEKGIQTCTKKLGKYHSELRHFFEKNEGYNTEMIQAETSIPEGDIKKMLMWYARLELGEKILKCVEERGCCEFSAEL